eukprot:4948498-Pyramimonas_sp.AAC.1
MPTTARAASWRSAARRPADRAPPRTHSQHHALQGSRSTSCAARSAAARAAGPFAGRAGGPSATSSCTGPGWPASTLG